MDVLYVFLSLSPNRISLHPDFMVCFLEDERAVPIRQRGFHFLRKTDLIFPLRECFILDMEINFQEEIQKILGEIQSFQSQLLQQNSSLDLCLKKNEDFSKRIDSSLV